MAAPCMRPFPKEPPEPGAREWRKAAEWTGAPPSPRPAHGEDGKARQNIV